MRFKKTLISISVLMVFGWANFCWAGLGVSPSTLIEKNLLQGSHLEKTFYVSRSETEADLKFKAVIEADEIKDWLKIEPRELFTIKKGENSFPLKIIVDVPKNADLHSYKADLRITSLPGDNKEETGAVGSSAILGVLAQLDLAVTDKELLEYKVSDIAIPNTEEGSPIIIVFSVKNTGNIKARPTKVKVDFFDQYKKGLLKSYEISDLSKVKFVKPFSFEKMEIKIPNELGAGQYWGMVEVYQDEELLDSRKVIFDIAAKEKAELAELKEEEKNDFEKETLNLGLEPEGKIDNRDCILAGVIIATLILVIGFGMFGIMYKWEKSGLKLEIKLKRQKKETKEVKKTCQKEKHKKT